MKVFCAAFSQLQFGLVIFWQLIIGKKSCLYNLCEADYYVLRTNFSYKRLFVSFFYIHVTREKLLKQCLYKKLVRKMLIKLTTGVNFNNNLRAAFLREYPKSAKKTVFWDLRS